MKTDLTQCCLIPIKCRFVHMERDLRPFPLTVAEQQAFPRQIAEQPFYLLAVAVQQAFPRQIAEQPFYLLAVAEQQALQLTYGYRSYESQ
ncbi:MAG: hypothetical protein FWH55_09045 [Oscillospiraceae bacterium]|nr:hypothetical protein [Oscillospiraceae bacterium]